MAYVQSGMIVGLGTGSTSDYFLQALGHALKEGKVSNIRAVPTSRKSEQRAQHLGIPLTTLAENPTIDVAVDGADEVTPDLGLIKGLGGALLREKIIAQAAKQFIVIADSAKRVDVLGTKSPLPVEVTQFSHEAHVPFFTRLGCVPTLRRTPEGNPFVTDNGNYIYDCRFPRIDDAAELELKLLKRAGVVDTGLFLGIAAVVLVADENDVQTLKR